MVEAKMHRILSKYQYWILVSHKSNKTGNYVTVSVTHYSNTKY